MADVDINKKVWNEDYPWPQRGEEWSFSWGGADRQWYITILPRIHSFLPAETILEIAPGFGRWTQYLKEHCMHLIVVDLSEKCIEFCKKRFSQDSHISYHVNDGKSLAMIPDNSIDFAFSFDSLVHAEEDVIQSYLSGLAKKNKKRRRGLYTSFKYRGLSQGLFDRTFHFEIREAIPLDESFSPKENTVSG